MAPKKRQSAIGHLQPTMDTVAIVLSTSLAGTMAQWREIVSIPRQNHTPYDWRITSALFVHTHSTSLPMHKLFSAKKVPPITSRYQSASRNTADQRTLTIQSVLFAVIPAQTAIRALPGIAPPFDPARRTKIFTKELAPIEGITLPVNWHRKPRDVKGTTGLLFSTQERV